MNKEYHNQYNLQRYYKKRKEYIDFLGGKCVKCNSTENLQFDHIDSKTKLYAIGDKITYPKEKIMDELKKCQLLCRSCHIFKTIECKDGYERRPKGERIKISKLTTNKVLEIRSLLGKQTLTKIAKDYGVTRASIRNIRDVITFKHI
jgi:5-methylcytosine-specific restriction endonuclease McrA